MSKLMTRLEKLAEFQKRGESIRVRQTALHAEAQAIDIEFKEWLQTEFGLDGQHHLSDILKVALETSIEPKAEG